MTIYEAVSKSKTKLGGIRDFDPEEFSDMIDDFIGNLKGVVNEEYIDIKTRYTTINKFNKNGVGKAKNISSNAEIHHKNGLFDITINGYTCHASKKSCQYHTVTASLAFNGTTDKEEGLYLSLRKLVKKF